jgi:hypothetical protein
MLQGELTPGVAIGALPAVVLRLELHTVTTAGRAEHLTVSPTPGNHVIAAILGVREVDYRFLKGGGFGCHDYSVPEFHGIVKYIYTMILLPGAAGGEGQRRGQE